MRTRDVIDLVALGFLWGASFLFMRIAGPEFGALALVEVRVVIAAAVLLPILIARGLPPRFSDEAAKACAAMLSRIEAKRVDTPPFLGAWCTLPESGMLSFAGFWPNLLHQPGEVTSIAFWCWARSRFARPAIANLH